MAPNLPKQLDKKKSENWAPVFFPKDFVRNNFGLTLENFQLDIERLLLEGKRVTTLRKSFRQKAEMFADKIGEQLNQSEKDIEIAIKKVQSRKANKKVETKIFTR